MNERSHNKVNIILTLLLLVGAVIFLYPNSKPSSAQAATVFQTMSTEVENKSDYYKVQAKGEVLGGVIIFPDDREDPVDYAPMAQKLSARGLEVRVVRYPLNRARFKTDINKILRGKEDIAWVSIGIGKGAEKACSLGDNLSEVAGLILIGSCSNDVNLNDNDLQITLFQLDSEPMDQNIMQEVRKKLPSDTIFQMIASREKVIGQLMASGEADLQRSKEVEGSDPLSVEINRILTFEPKSSQQGD